MDHEQETIKTRKNQKVYGSSGSVCLINQGLQSQDRQETSLEEEIPLEKRLTMIILLGTYRNKTESDNTEFMESISDKMLDPSFQILQINSDAENDPQSLKNSPRQHSVPQVSILETKWLEDKISPLSSPMAREKTTEKQEILEKFTVVLSQAEEMEEINSRI